MRNSILFLHIITSVVACFVTLYIVFKAVEGLAKNRPTKPSDVKLPFYATLLLYLQLALGTALYVFYMIDYANGDIDFAKEPAMQSRFWAVEHFVLMVFTLVISHIGWIFARSSKSPTIIFKKNLLYFGVASLLIMVSMAMNVVKHN